MANDVFAANRRSVALQALAQDFDYSLSNELLQRALRAIGHTVSIVAVDGLIDWLAERDLISVTDVGRGIRVAQLTRYGLDVATGAARAEGVDRPRPV